MPSARPIIQAFAAAARRGWSALRAPFVAPGEPSTSPTDALLDFAPHTPTQGRFDLVAIDIDGTLLRPDKRLAHRVIRAVSEASQRGVKVVLATARPPRSVRAIYEALNLDTPQINYNGALIHDQRAGRAILHQPVPVQLGSQLIRYARRVDPNVIIGVEILDRWYTDHTDHAGGTRTTGTFRPDFVGPLEAFIHKPATKILLQGSPERLGRVKAALCDRYRKRASILICDSQLVQVLHAGADKQVALERIALSYGIPRSRVMAIGDAPNDERMIRWAGLGVAMKNAWPTVRAAAGAIVSGNDADGVAEALKRFVLA